MKMNKYWARYNKNFRQSLQEHAQSVGFGCWATILECVQFEGADPEYIRKLVRFCGLSHDVGKFTTFFQDFLLRGLNSPEKDHAHISALFLYNLLLKTQNDDSSSSSRMIRFLCYLAVRLHHGRLAVHNQDLYPQDILKKLQNKQKNLLENTDAILQEFPFACNREDFVSCLNLDHNILQELCDVPHLFRYQQFRDAQWYFFLIMLFSILIDQDKLDSAQITPATRKQIEPQRVIEYLQQKTRKSSINSQREAARKEIMQTLADLSDQEILEDRIFTLTAPTGIGKTLAALQAAANLAIRLKKLSYGTFPRIITAIPFINIIEQSLADYQQICGEDVSLLAHYHLGQIEVSPDENKPLEKALLETESWEADVVMTTFVQLFHSLLSDRNRSLKKINKLVGSIVILDEIQAIPDEYLPLIGALIKRLSIHYGTRFILMTATQPEIMELANRLEDYPCKVKELLPNHGRYFERLNRTQFISLLGAKPMNEEEFVDKFQQLYDGQKAALVVVNTIQRSLNLFHQFKDIYPRRVLYLSTNLIPKARKRVIKKASHYLRCKIPFVLISTQTIEAGVDLDFDLAFRDLAPLPSLIQTAGRVGRNGDKGEHLPIYIMELENDCGQIYETFQKNRIKRLLQSKFIICEKEYRVLVNRYYKDVSDDGLSDQCRKIWEGIVELDFEKIKEFQLIKQNGEIKDIFVEYDEDATKLADQYIALRRQLDLANRDEYFALKAHLRNTWAQMQQYLLSIRVKRLKDNLPPNFSDRSFGEVKCDFFWIPQGQLNEYYDAIYGFKGSSELHLY